MSKKRSADPALATHRESHRCTQVKKVKTGQNDPEKEQQSATESGIVVSFLSRLKHPPRGSNSCFPGSKS